VFCRPKQLAGAQVEESDRSGAATTNSAETWRRRIEFHCTHWRSQSVLIFCSQCLNYGGEGLQLSGVNGSVTLGDGLTQRGRYPGERKSPTGVKGPIYPIGGLVDEPPKLILILEMHVKLIFYGGKIENAYTCLVVFLKERMLQSCRYTTIDIHKTLMYVYYVQLTIRIGGDGK